MFIQIRWTNESVILQPSSLLKTYRLLKFSMLVGKDAEVPVSIGYHYNVSGMQEYFFVTGIIANYKSKK